MSKRGLEAGRSWMGAFLALGLLYGAGCGGGASGVPAEDAWSDGIAAFEAYDLARASEIFASAAAARPDDAELAWAHGRLLAELNRFEEAIPALERAMQLAPADPRIYAPYLEALVWGGNLRGRREWLERAFTVGEQALRTAPWLTPIYEQLESAVRELNDPTRLIDLLEAMEPGLGDSPVFQAHLLGARLAGARAAEDAAEIAAFEAELRTMLAAAALRVTEATDEEQAPTVTELRYQLAYGHKLLGDAAAERSWLEQLDSTELGRYLGGKLVHFDVFYPDYFPTIRAQYQGELAEIEEAFALLDRWQERFPVRWENPRFGTHRIPLQRRAELLTAIVRERVAGTEAATETGAPGTEVGDPAAAGDGPLLPGRSTESILTEIASLAEQLAWLDTWGGADHYLATGRNLLRLDADPAHALRLAEAGLRELERGRPGMIYPGTPPEEVDEAIAGRIAALQRVQGQALHRLGRIAEAEAALRASMDQAAQSDRLLALGELLLDTGRTDEGYEALVGALAWQPSDERIDDVDEVRARALEALRDLGRPESALEADLRIATERADDERIAAIVGERLDLPAPDFVLTDTAGNEWRLSDLRGKVVVLNYWATWCGPCRSEFPHYARLVKEYAPVDDVVFLAINTDVERAVPRAFLAEEGYDFTVLFDAGSSTDYRVNGIPAHFIIGPEGRIRYKASGFPGPERYAEEMKLRIDALRGS